MKKRVYLITEFGGEWEDSWELLKYAFFNEDKCKEMLTHLKEHVSKMESYRTFWEEIIQKLNQIEHPEYDAFFDIWDHLSEIPKKFENYLYYDSFERFEYWMENYFLEDYDKLNKELWKELYQYYQTESKYYDDSTNYFMSSLEIYDA